MKKITLAFSALCIFIITACSTNVDKKPVEPFHPRQIGAYYVGSPALANYTGKQSQPNNIAAKAVNYTGQDTILIMRPIDISFDIRATDYQNYKLDIQLYWAGIGVKIPNMESIHTRDLGKVQLDPIGWVYDSNDNMSINFGIRFKPNLQASGDFTFVTVRDTTHAPLITFKIYTAGMDSTVAYMLRYQ